MTALCSMYSSSAPAIDGVAAWGHGVVASRTWGCRLASLYDTGMRRTDVLKVVDVQEDLHANQQQAELPLDGGALVLSRAPDAARG